MGEADELLTTQDKEEGLSRAYAEAIATRAGYVTAHYSADRDSIDLRIQAGGDERPAIELQLKATINLGEPKNGCFRFPLKIKNYNDLRIATQTPRLLVVLDMPRVESRWMSLTKDELILRKAAYWLSLRGYRDSTNKEKVTVYIPTGNLFNVENLHKLMDQSRSGRIQ